MLRHLQIRPRSWSSLLRSSASCSQGIQTSNDPTMNALPSSLRCLQLNLRHSRAAALNLSQIILELGVDVALIQEPYAAPNPMTGAIEMKFVPPGYITVHNLDTQHAYGSAIILKSSLQKYFLPLVPANHLSCVVTNIGGKSVCFLSIYCRPSTRDIADSFQSILLSIPPNSLKNIVIGADLNHDV